MSGGRKREHRSGRRRERSKYKPEEMAFASNQLGKKLRVNERL
jgi:hypothetical protein